MQIIYVCIPPTHLRLGFLTSFDFILICISISSTSLSILGTTLQFYVSEGGKRNVNLYTAVCELMWNVV